MEQHCAAQPRPIEEHPPTCPCTWCRERREADHLRSTT